MSAADEDLEPEYFFRDRRKKEKKKSQSGTNHSDLGERAPSTRSPLSAQIQEEEGPGKWLARWFFRGWGR